MTLHHPHMPMKNEGKVPIPLPTASDFAVLPRPHRPHLATTNAHTCCCWPPLLFLLLIPCSVVPRSNQKLSATRIVRSPLLSCHSLPACHALCPPLPPLVLSSPARLSCVVPCSVTCLSCIVHPFLLAIMLAAPSCCFVCHLPALLFDCCVLVLMPSPMSHHHSSPHKNCYCNCWSPSLYYLISGGATKTS